MKGNWCTAVQHFTWEQASYLKNKSVRWWKMKLWSVAPYPPCSHHTIYYRCPPPFIHNTSFTRVGSWGWFFVNHFYLVYFVFCVISCSMCEVCCVLLFYHVCCMSCVLYVVSYVTCVVFLSCIGCCVMCCEMCVVVWCILWYNVCCVMCSAVCIMCCVCIVWMCYNVVACCVFVVTCVHIKTMVYCNTANKVLDSQGSDIEFLLKNWKIGI